MALLKLIFCVYLITLIISMIVALIKFIIDTFRWHDREEKVEIFASSSDPEYVENSIENISEEKEVEKNGTDDRQCNSSTFSVPWCES